jgi:hypothetical protein
MMPMLDKAEFINLMNSMGRDEHGKVLDQSAENKEELKKILESRKRGLDSALKGTHKMLLADMSSYCQLHKESEALEQLMKEMLGEKNDD